MGETQGSMWTTGLFIILFFGMTTMLFWGLDIMKYNSAVYTIEDNIKAGNYMYCTNVADKDEANDGDDSRCTDGVESIDITQTLDDKFNVCTTVVKTDLDCTGIVSVENRIITYQVSYNGVMLNYDVSDSNDSIVLLPY